MADSQTAKKFLQAVSTSGGPAQERFQEIQALYDKKLWHNVTEKVHELVQANILNDEELRILYTDFIKYFDTRINQLTLAQIGIRIAKTYPIPQNIEFLQSIVTRMQEDPETEEAKLLIQSQVLLFNLDRGESSREESKIQLEALEKTLITHSGPRLYATLIYSNFYLAKARYFQMMHLPMLFYENSMLYLSYTPVEKIPIDEQRKTAYALALAALVGEDIYNFGDLLSHPILHSLRGTQHEWLEQFLYSFNSGNMGKYNQILTECKSQFESIPELVSSKDLLQQKISILCLMELVLDKQSTDRVFSFKEIAERTRLSEDLVELLVMKALSLKLLKGSIDQVESKVIVTWVQPRVLDLEQVARMRDRLEGWKKKVMGTLIHVEQQTGELAA